MDEIHRVKLENALLLQPDCYLIIYWNAEGEVCWFVYKVIEVTSEGFSELACYNFSLN